MRLLFNIILLILFGTSLSAQNFQKKLEKAKSLHNDYKYDSALKIYEEVHLLPGGNADMSIDDKRRFADCYKLTNRSEKAEPIYAEIASDPKGNYQVFYDYAEILKFNGKYDEAKKWFDTYSKVRPADPRGKSMSDLCDKIKAIRPLYPDALVKPAGSSTEDADEFSPTLYNGKVIFTSDRSGKNMGKSDWTGRSYTDIFQASIMEDGSLSQVDYFDRRFNAPSRYDGPVAFANFGTVSFLSRNNETEDLSGTIKMQILYSERKGEDWSKFESIKIINGEAYSTMHPAPSPDGKMLYFASNRPGGFGGFDIWVTEFKFGEWTKPVNLGKNINTEGDEAFPFITDENTLYFSSKNGHPSLGGFDIFVSTNNGVSWSTPVNLGAPINSTRDDTGFIIDEIENRGYFASSREVRDFRNDDLYYFEILKLSLRGLILEKDALIPIKDATITFKDENYELKTSSDGAFSSILEKEKNYTCIVSAKGFQTQTFTVSTVGISESKVIEKNILMEKDQEAAYSLNVNIIDKFTRKPVGGSTVLFIKSKGAFVTKEDGNYYTNLDPNKKYTYKVIKEGYNAKSFDVETTGADESKRIELIVELEPTVVVAPKVELLLGVAVFDKSDSAPLTDVQVALKNLVTQETENRTTDATGSAMFSLQPKTRYEIIASKNGYIQKSQTFGAGTYADDEVVREQVLLDKLEVGKIIKLDNIYYDLGKYYIRPDAAVELDKLVNLMLENPNLVIELRSHTDSRSSAESNMTLSQNRAKAAVDYLISKGIAAERLVAKGYGESELTNQCADGVNCNEEQHQANRRTEFKILGL